MDDRGGACTDACGITCTDKHTYGIKGKDARGSTCMDYRGSTCMDVSTDSTDLHGIMCPYTYTYGAGFHGLTSTEDSVINTDVRGRNNTYDEYRRYKPKRYMVMYVVGKLWKVVRYDDSLQQCP